MDQSFPKKFRLRKKWHFRRLSRLKRTIGQYLVIEAERNNKGYPRLGITVTKRFGKAHERNRFKRLVREIFRLQKEKFNSLDLNVRPRHSFHTSSITFAKIEQDLLQLLQTL